MIKRFLQIIFLILPVFIYAKHMSGSMSWTGASQKKTWVKGQDYQSEFTFKDSSGERISVIYALKATDIDESTDRYGYTDYELTDVIQEQARIFNNQYKDDAFVTVKSARRWVLNYKDGHRHLNDRFNKMCEEAMNSYYSRHLLLLEGETLYPDYAAVQLLQADAVKGIYDSLRTHAQQERTDERRLITLLSQFVQSLPYKKPPEHTDRETLGFWTPVQCLLEQAGDCDSKSTLFATLFYHYRHNGCILIMTGRHAFIGIKNGHKMFPADNILKIGGQDYLFVETTAPHPLGFIARSELLQIRHGHFQHIAYH